MAKNKWLNKLMAMEGAVQKDRDPNLEVIQSPSPYLNWAFANKGHGLPRGYSMILGGPPKAGKSFITLSMIGEMHRTDADGIAIIFNTELRGELQDNETSMKMFGIDPDRLVVYDTNQPDQIFDRIAIDINGMADEGMPIRIIAIDSVSQIQGRRDMNATTVMQQQIGDQAATIQAGLGRILPVIRRHKISTILCTHVRAEMDPVKVMRGEKYRLQGAFAIKHFAEFFCFVERNESKSGKETLGGDRFENEGMKDAMGRGDLIGHKIRFKVLDSSIGIANRVGEFTIDYKKGIVNKHEEVFTLALNTGVIEKPNNITYKFGDVSYRGKDAILTALRDDLTLQHQIIQKVYQLDILGDVRVEKEGETDVEKIKTE